MESDGSMSSKMLSINDIEGELTHNSTISNLSINSLSIENPKFSKEKSSTLTNNNFPNKIKNFLRPLFKASFKFKNTSMNKDERSKFLDEMKENFEISQARGKINNVYLQREEAHIEFNYYFFIKFLLYHMLFYYTLGPIFGLLLIPFEGYNMVRNMGFLGINSISIFQNFTYLSCAPNIIFRILYKSNSSFGSLRILDLAEMIFCNLAVIIRCFIIAFRYGYTSSSQIQNRYSKEIPNIKREYLISGWRHIQPNIIDIEVHESLVRTNIETETFKFNFLSQCYDEWIMRLTDDDYYKTKDKEYLKRMYYSDNTIQQMEDNLKKELRKSDSLLDKNIYSKLTPFLNRVKTEKELSKYYRKSTNSSDISSSFDDNKNSINYPDEIKSTKSETLIENSNCNVYASNERLDDIRKTESYKLYIKKLSKHFSSIKSSENRRISFPIDNKKIPYYLKTPEVEEIWLDYPGRLIIRELMYLSRIRSNKLFKYIVYFMIAFHSFSAVIYRWILYNQPFGKEWIDQFSILYDILIFIFVFYKMMLFVEIGGNDYNRRLFCMKALSAMITPDKSLLDPELKVVPTINFFCPINLNNWLNSRLILMDVGLRFMKRIEIYASSLLVTYLLIIFIGLLGNLEILQYFSFVKYPIIYLVGYTQAIIFFFVIYRMILLGVKLNSYFQIHKTEISYLKFSVNYILMNWEIFMSMSTYVNPYLTKAKEYYYHCQQYHRRFSIEKIDEHRLYGIQIPKTEQEFKEHLTKLIRCYDEILEKIEIEEKSKPVKLIGIKIDSNFMKDFYIALITFFVSLFQYFFMDK